MGEYRCEDCGLHLSLSPFQLASLRLRGNPIPRPECPANADGRHRVSDEQLDALAPGGATEETEDEADAQIVRERDAADTGERIPLSELIEEHLASPPGGDTAPPARCDGCNRKAWCHLVGRQFLCDECAALAPRGDTPKDAPGGDTAPQKEGERHEHEWIDIFDPSLYPEYEAAPGIEAVCRVCGKQTYYHPEAAAAVLGGKAISSEDTPGGDTAPRDPGKRTRG